MRTLLVALLLSSTLHAGVSIITGQIKDAQGNPINGTLVMRLPIPAQDPTTQAAIAPVPVTFGLVNGNVTGGAPLYDLATIQPKKLWYSARAYDTTGALVFYGNYFVTGAVFNIGAATPTVVTTANISFTTIPQGGATFGTVVTTGSTIQSTINAVATAGTGAPVVIPQGYTGSGNFTNTSFLPILNFTPSPNGDYDKNGVLPVDIFGVRHDGQAALCNPIAGNTQMTCVGQLNPFTQADVGKLILVYGAGPSSQAINGTVLGLPTASGGSGGTPGTQALVTTNGGCTYPMRGWVTVSGAGSVPPGANVTVWKPAFGCTSIPSTATVATVTGTVTINGANWTNVDLPTTISGVINGTTITIATAPTVSTGSEEVLYGTDDYLPLQDACNGRNQAQNGGHYTHSGISMISQGPLCQGNDVWIQGAGWAPLINSGGGSAIVYAGTNTNGTGTDGIWNTASGWGAKLTDIGLRGNSYALPRGIRIMKGQPGLTGNGNSAIGEYDRVWIGWMWGDAVGIPATGGIPQISKGIFADIVSGNGDFNNFDKIYINGTVHGIDGNNDQATQWLMGNIQVQSSYIGLCSFSSWMMVHSLFTEFNDSAIVLGPCIAGTGFGNLIIDNFQDESSAQSIRFATLGAGPNQADVWIHSGGTSPDSLHQDPSGITIDLTGTINTGSIMLGDGPNALQFGTTGKIKMPAFGNTGFGPKLSINGQQSNTFVLSAGSCGPACNNSESSLLTLNGNTLQLDNADYTANGVPPYQNDFSSWLREFGSLSILGAKAPGQTDNGSVRFFGVNQPGVFGPTGSTTYNYIVTCTDAAGHETSGALSAQGYGWDFNTIYGVEVRTTVGPATLSTSNYIQVSLPWGYRGCAFYNLYGDEGSGAIGYLTTITSAQFYTTSQKAFNDQGQFTKNTSRTPPLLGPNTSIGNSGALVVQGPTTLSNRLNIADKGTCTMAAGTCAAQTLAAVYANAPTCFATFTGTGTLAGTIKISSTTTTVTPASTTGTDTAQVNWACLGN